jgi:ribosomal protein L1
MAQQGKRLKAAYTGFDREKTYALDEAVKLARGAAKAKFDETIEISMNLGIDPRRARRGGPAAWHRQDRAHWRLCPWCQG